MIVFYCRNKMQPPASENICLKCQLIFFFRPFSRYQMVDLNPAPTALSSTFPIPHIYYAKKEVAAGVKYTPMLQLICQWTLNYLYRDARLRSTPICVCVRSVRVLALSQRDNSYVFAHKIHFFFSLRLISMEFHMNAVAVAGKQNGNGFVWGENQNIISHFIFRTILVQSFYGRACGLTVVCELVLLFESNV